MSDLVEGLAIGYLVGRGVSKHEKTIKKHIIKKKKTVKRVVKRKAKNGK